jgi:hypothetical protein
MGRYVRPAGFISAPPVYVTSSSGGMVRSSSIRLLAMALPGQTAFAGMPQQTVLLEVVRMCPKTGYGLPGLIRLDFRDPSILGK